MLLWQLACFSGYRRVLKISLPPSFVFSRPFFLLLPIFVGEDGVLLTSRSQGRTGATMPSKYVLEGKQLNFSCPEYEIGPMPLRPDTPEGAAVHRELRWRSGTV